MKMNKLIKWFLGLLLILAASSCSRPISYNFTIENSDGKRYSEVGSTHQTDGFHWHGHGQGPIPHEGSLFHDVQQIERTGEGVRMRVILWSVPSKDKDRETFRYDKTHFLTFDRPFSVEPVPGLWLKGVVTTNQKAEQVAP
jgi:hypothetical protein